MNARLLFIVLGLTALTGSETWAQEGAGSQFTVDDRALKERLRQGLELLLDVEGVPRGRELLRSVSKSDKVNVATKPNGGEPPSSVEIYRRAIRSSVIIGHLYKCDNCSKWHASQAGGVIIDPSGIVVTAHHVMDSDRAEVFGAMTSGGEVFPIIKVLAASEPDDLAIVQLNTGDRQLDTSPIAPKNAPPGSGLRALSHPAGQFFTYSEGIVARYYFDPSARASRMQITADYARGSSGCGVYNTKGELTGIVSSTRSIYYNQHHGEQRNLQMVQKSCIPIASLRRLLRAGRNSPDQDAHD